ncbi:MAG: DUF4159 domain-containing protein [Alphaproteobacteria bacterium]|nr:DUF4159 domain-containing protein [Alphaproteobacteria bacterium SS10]
MIEAFGTTIAFGAPWALAGLLLLPVLWWVLRLLPPRPRLVAFPNLRLLRDLLPTEQTPARLPWWLMLLRMIFAALLILAASQPTLNPRDPLAGDGPLVFLIENDWSTGGNWADRVGKLQALLDRPGVEDRPIVFAPTAMPANGDPLELFGPYSETQAAERLASIAPQPWAGDMDLAVGNIADWLEEQGSAVPSIYWISSGLEHDGDDEALSRLTRLGDVTLVRAAANNLPVILRPPGSGIGADKNIDDGPSVMVERSAADRPAIIRIQTLGSEDRLLSDQQVELPADTASVPVALTVPDELRSDIRQVRIIGADHAAARVLFDDRFVRRPVGLIAGGIDRESQPLLDQRHYLRQALNPFAEVREGDLDQLLAQPLAVLMMADIGTIDPDAEDRLNAWIREGGLLVRFAGPQLANSGENLLPVRLRQGDRSLGGALSWTEPVPLADFPDNSPFDGMAVPPDVTIERQVLAEPALDLNERTWARLVDGTPLVTAEARGRGYLVLFHTTASPDWSNLALSGLFVDMLQRLMPLSAGVDPGQSAEANRPANLAPIRILDGFGTLIEPGPMVQPLPIDTADIVEIGPEHPPGLYGRDAARRALNLGAELPTLQARTTVPSGMALEPLSVASQTPLLPLLILLALIIGLVDWGLAQWLSGSLDRFSGGLSALKSSTTRRAATAGLTALFLTIGATANAQGLTLDEERAIKITSGTYLGYVITGDRSVDEISHAGLEGLSGILRRRTAAEVDGAIAVDIKRDDLALFPLLYWPITEVQQGLDSNTVARLNHYMRHGGMIIFDTRDKLQGGLEEAGPGVQRLRQLTRNLDMPPLRPIDPDHVMTRAFYLLQIFPGRYAGGEVWVERTDERRNDGVASVVIGVHDWASAWAVGPDNRPMLPVVPGGERQRELAYRFGVNLVMYALTGNYKADQVHVPFILERLGQ